MMAAGLALYALGLAACWFIGRYVERYADLAQGAAVGLCGIAGTLAAFPDSWADNFLWVLGILFVYGIVGAFVYRHARARREGGS